MDEAEEEEAAPVRARSSPSAYTTVRGDESSAAWTFDGRGPEWDADADEFEYEFYDAQAGLWRPLSPDGRATSPRRGRSASPRRKSPTAIATSVPRGSPRVYQLGTPSAPSAVVLVNEKKKKGKSSKGKKSKK